MDTQSLEKLRFPIGEFVAPDHIDEDTLTGWIADIESFAQQARACVQYASPDQLTWRYRPGGWTLTQLVHHCADSHLNAFTRFRLALTENNPTIRPYNEAAWANLPDSLSPNLGISLTLLDGLHARWACLLKSLSPLQWGRTYVHPEHGKQFTLRETAGSYSWHCRHHLAHMRQAMDSKGEY